MNAWLPVAAYVALIFTLSSIPSLAPPGGMAHADKAAHVVEYAMLGALLARAFGASGGTSGRARMVCAFAVGLAVAALDEWCQGYSGRERSVADGFADAAGLAAGIAADGWMRGRAGWRRWAGAGGEERSESA